MSPAGLRLAAVLAHPDDESRIVGGTLALAASRGVEVTLYCATRGEAGDLRRPATEVATLRERELRCACEVLGVSDTWLDDFPDGGLDQADPAAVLGRIVRFVRATRPHALVTFGPDGRTGHADHIAVGRLAGRAFEAAGDAGRFPEQLGEGLTAWQPGWLYHTAVPHGVARRLGWTAPAVGEEDLVAVDVAPVLARKQQAAVECHASQWALSPMPLGEGGDWSKWSVEHFRLAGTAEPPSCPDPVTTLAQPRPAG